MGQVASIIEEGDLIDRQTAVETINRAAGYEAFDARTLMKERSRAPRPEFVDERPLYSRRACVTFGRSLAARQAGGTPDAA